MENNFNKILSKITGYTVAELKERNTEPLIQPFDCLLAMEQIKLLNLHDVTQRSELFIDFLEWYHKPDKQMIGHVFPDIVDKYLKSINDG